jgi:hypothetical protein
MIAGAEWLPALKPEKPVSTNAANEVAKKFTGRDYISRSAISTFWQSPLKYRFRYVDGLPEQPVSTAHVFGTGVHSAVERHFQAILSGGPQRSSTPCCSLTARCGCRTLRRRSRSEPTKPGSPWTRSLPGCSPRSWQLRRRLFGAAYWGGGDPRHARPGHAGPLRPGGPADRGR